MVKLWVCLKHLKLDMENTTVEKGDFETFEGVTRNKIDHKMFDSGRTLGSWGVSGGTESHSTGTHKNK